MLKAITHYIAPIPCYTASKATLSNSAFGSVMPTRSWSDASRAYRYGFNGKEKDFETGNDNYDFGARIYDGRLGRWLSVDRFGSKFSWISCYSFASNSPLFFVDILGDYPKVAIIIVPVGAPLSNEFNDHVAALEKQGYQVVYAKNGQEAIDKMNLYSTPESPTENLILLSHGSPGGLSVKGAEDGIWTKSELEIFTMMDWANTNRTSNETEYLKSKGLITDPTDPNFNQIKIDEALNDPNFNSDFQAFEKTLWAKVQNKDQLMNDYKNMHGIATTEDIANAMNSGTFETKNLTIVLGGCNLAGYYPLDYQVIFSTELAIATGSTVYASQGYTQPEIDEETKKSKKNTSRTSTHTWTKTTSDGTQIELENKTLDLAKPE